MSLDPYIFLNSTYLFCVISLILGIWLYGKYTPFSIYTPHRLEKVDTSAVSPIDFLGIGLLLTLFASLLLLTHTPPDVGADGELPTQSKTLVPLDVVALMIGQSVPAIIILVILMARGVQLGSFFGLRLKKSYLLLIIAPTGVILTYIFMICLSRFGYMEWLTQVFSQNFEDQDALRIYKEADTVVIRVLLAISVVVIAPIVEEVIFRGYIYTVTKRYTGPIFSALLSALIFAVVHNFVPGLVPLAFLAILLTIAYEWTGSLWAPISIHALFNASTLISQEIALQQS